MIVGGEFEIDIRALEEPESDLTDRFTNEIFYSSGRAALYHIIKLSKCLGKTKILIPDYLCESIISVIKLAGIPFAFYSINQDLTINLDSLVNKYETNCQVLIINYFGGSSVAHEVNQLKSIIPDIFIVIDNVQAFYSMFQPMDVEFMFTSFRKWFPVPDGAWVITKHKGLKICNNKNTFSKYKLAGGVLKSQNLSELYFEDIYLELFKKGEREINENINSMISSSALKILKSIDFNEIRNRRIKNYLHLKNGLSLIGVKPVLEFNNNLTPLFLPIYIQNRDLAQNKLRDNKFFCPSHWPRCKETAVVKQDLYENELSLIIDQRYSENIIDEMLTILKQIL